MAQDMERVKQLNKPADLKINNTKSKTATSSNAERQTSPQKPLPPSSQRLASDRPTPKPPSLPTKPPTLAPQNKILSQSAYQPPDNSSNDEKNSSLGHVSKISNLPSLKKPKEPFAIKPKSHPQQPPTPPTATHPSPEKAQKTLKQILDEAKKRSLEGLRSQDTDISHTTKPSSLDDLLPIEKSPTSTKMTVPKTVEPPLNLPTGLPNDISAQNPPPTDRKQNSAPQASAPIALPKKSTPEDILGLSPQKQTDKSLGTPPKASFKPSLPQIPSGSKESTQKISPGVLAKTSPLKNKNQIKSKSSPLKFVAVAGVLGFVAIVASLGIVWRIFLYEPPPVVEPSPVGPSLPMALIYYSEQESIEIDSLTYDLIKPKLDSLSNLTFPTNSLAYVPIKLLNDRENAYLTLKQLFNALQIDAPSSLLNLEEYTLFLYTPDTFTKDLCQEENTYSSLCYGPRLGLAIKLPQPDSITKSTMSEWEKTITQDLAPLMLFAPDITGLRTLQFSDGLLNGVTTRYINMPIHSMSVDWILTDTHLIISTSKDSARAAFDNLIK